ncbi:MAG: 2Fe-2S iron-sulfur cluster binding domain-containing protein [Rhodocyclaceae bacterium]|nr:MAG: 2Fe-2S iron-sulfur cluster binding domain-containing protein [Rhodocyclaceae bacterium]
MTIYKIKLSESGESFNCSSDQSILSGMEQIGRNVIPVGCRSGGCGICKLRISSGVVSKKIMSRTHISAKEEAEGYVLACRAFPRSDLEVQVVGLMQKNVLER